MDIKKRIIDKINEGQEPDVKLYRWETISDSLKFFWSDYFAKLDSIKNPLN